MNQPRRPSGPPPFPDVRSAFLLTVGAILAAVLVGVLFLDLGPLAAEGIGTALGIGGVATLAARRVAEPQAARIGLAPLPWRAWPLILCLVPALLVASELDNIAYDWSPKSAATEQTDTKAPATNANDAKDEAGADRDQDAEIGESAATVAPESESKESVDPAELIIDPDNPFNLMEALIVVVGIKPVIHEFLFRGVLQQGLVAQLGLMRGVTLASLLWTMLRPPGLESPARFAAAFVAWFALGWLLGMVRASTGSILGSILLGSLWAAIDFVSFALKGRVEVPGMNVEGTHLPVAVTLASVLLVAWAARRIYDEATARERPAPS